MLTALATIPKHEIKHATQPEKWQGVKAGLEEGSSLLQQHEFFSAEEAVRQVLEFAPMEGQAWHLLGRILQKNNRHAEALDCFSRAESCYIQHKQEQDSPVSIRLAHVLWRQGQYEEARSMLDILMMRSPDDDSLRQLHHAWIQQEGQTA